MNDRPVDPIENLVSSILAYIEYLTKDLCLRLTLHHVDNAMTSHFGSILRYNVHEHPVCVYLKRNPAIWEECVERQKKVRERAESGPYFGTCWAGMGEFVFPIRKADQSTVGFISIGGYAGDPEKKERQFKKLCARYDLNREELDRLYEKSIDQSRPDIHYLKTLIEPLANLFTLLLIYQEQAEINLRKVGSNGEVLIAAVKRYLERHAEEDISLAQLAEHFNCSSGYLSRIIHDYAHCNYRSYVNGMKMHMARIYLEATKLSIQEISHTLGFSDSNYFSTVFRHETGVSPRQWRQAHAQKTVFDIAEGGKSADLIDPKGL